MALLLLLAVGWAFSWLLWRAYSVITTPNEILVEKLGLDIPPVPLVTLESITARDVQISWKHAETSSSVQEHHIEVNGRLVGATKKHEMGALIENLLPGTIYEIRVFCISPGTFQTPSATLHVRTPSAPAAAHNDSSEHPPTVKAVPLRSPLPVVAPLSAPSMVREVSGGQPAGRRGTTGRRPSPANHVAEGPAVVDGGSKPTEGEMDGDLAELSQRFQKVQQDIDAVEAQIHEEEKEFEVNIKEQEARRDELKHSLKERDEVSNDLRKQVHKAETASRTAQSEKSKRERLLQSKQTQRRQRRDEIAKWEEQIASMKEEIAGIDTQQAAIERRAKTEQREITKRTQEAQKDVTLLEDDNKEKALQIKALEDERHQVDEDDETDEIKEAERLDNERNIHFSARMDGHRRLYNRLWSELQMYSQSCRITAEKIATYDARRASFAPTAPFDMEAARQGMRQARRPRHTGSHGSSISSPRLPLVGVEPFPPVMQYTANPNASPTTAVPSYFNPQNGMTLTMPSELIPSTMDELEPVSSVPMSPRADSLLPADLLGDESADELPESDVPMTQRPLPELITSSFPPVSSPEQPEGAPRTDTPSAGSSSERSFSSPMQTAAPARDVENKTPSSGQEDAADKVEGDTVSPPPSKSKYMSMSTMFGLNRQRGKTLADQPPLLGSLKSGQSQSFPSNVDDFDPTSQPRRRLSYAGNWAFSGNLLRSNATPADREQDLSRLSATRRSILSFGKSTASSTAHDPFTLRSASLDPGIRGETSSPRPSSTYSFDKMPRPSVESQFHAWNPDKGLIRNSPLAPDWGSVNSFSRTHSRRPSFVYGSTSNVSLPPADEEVVEPGRRPSRPLQAPIGTRPASSQQAATPKLNPAAPSFTMLFGKRSDKGKDKAKPRDGKDKTGDAEAASPSESRKSKDANSIANTVSTLDSETPDRPVVDRATLDRTASGASAQLSVESTPVKPTFISKITRKASSNKFGSWKDKGGLFSRKDAATPNGENEEEQGSSEHLGKSLESTSTTPSAEEKKISRTGLGNWNFMRKSKKGKEDLTASEISESSERTSENGDEGDEDDA